MQPLNSAPRLVGDLTLADDTVPPWEIVNCTSTRDGMVPDLNSGTKQRLTATLLFSTVAMMSWDTLVGPLGAGAGAGRGPERAWASCSGPERAWASCSARARGRARARRLRLVAFVLGGFVFGDLVPGRLFDRLFLDGLLGRRVGQGDLLLDRRHAAGAHHQVRPGTADDQRDQHQADHTDDADSAEKRTDPHTTAEPRPPCSAISLPKLWTFDA